MSLPPQYSDEPTQSSAQHHSHKAKGYGAAGSDESQEPLLAAQSSTTAARGILDEETGGDPDGFKIGVAVADCDQVIRLAFIRKIYAILAVQLFATAIVSLFMALPGPVAFMQAHSWIIFIPIVASFVSLGLVYWKRHQHPANLILLGLFTVFEAMMIGTITSIYDSRIVLQALFITLGVFVGLTLFTFQTKVSAWLSLPS